jgi:hypothetical protein
MNRCWYLLLAAVLRSSSRTAADNPGLFAVGHLQRFKNHNWWQFWNAADDLLCSSEIWSDLNEEGDDSYWKQGMAPTTRPPLPGTATTVGDVTMGDDAAD